MQQMILMAVLAIMVYAVSLDLRIEDFRYVARHPLAVGAGLVAQFEVSSQVERCRRSESPRTEEGGCSRLS